MTLIAAFVLHARPYRNTSLLIDFLTESCGRVSVVARGMKKSKKSLANILQPFTPVLISFKGKSDLKTLTHVEELSKRISLTGKSLYCGLYLNELLVKLLEPLINLPEVFLGYRQAIQTLENPDIPLAPVLRIFELNLLNYLGYGIDLNIDAASSQPIKSEDYYYYQFAYGLVPVVDINSEQSHLAVKGQYIIDIINNDYNKESLKAVKHITKTALDHLLRGKQLNSRSFFKS